jgi:hypothetical protein
MAIELSGSTYSETDSSNNAASPVGMPEGMNPSGVNDSWRAAMGSIKRSYDRDHATAATTVGGTANAITLTYSVPPTAYVKGEKFAFVAGFANTSTTTVNINGLGAQQITQRSLNTAPAACTGGEIQAGDIIEIEYDGVNFQILGERSYSNRIFASPGYTYLPGGFILQWGAVAVPTSSTQTFTYLIPFPNSIFNIVITPNSAAAYGGVTSALLNSCAVGNLSGTSATFYVFAIGN